MSQIAKLVSIGYPVQVGMVYKHYSGKLYKIIVVARDSEDPESLRVIYQGLYNCPVYGPNVIWDRPYKMFTEDVIRDNTVQPRFSLVSED